MMSRSMRWPAEWEPQDAVIVAWPHAETDWRDNLAEVEKTYVALVTAISKFERALIIVADANLEHRARTLLHAARANVLQIEFVLIPYDDTWLRDSGPITLIRRRAAASSEKKFRLLDFRFTGWGGKFEASRDDQIVQNLFRSNFFSNAEHKRIEWALEGGGIESDGAGTILTTWQCLKLRHPQLSRVEIEEVLSESLASERVLWLDSGFLEGDDTDAHIDTLARFVELDHIVYQGCDDTNDAHFFALDDMQTQIHALKQRNGKPYRLTALPWPKPIFAQNGRRLAASYANFLIVNDAVLMPTYGDEVADARALAIMQRVCPERKIAAISCRALIEQNGSLHCVTMQLPQGVLNVK